MWPDEPAVRDYIDRPRDDLVAEERSAEGVFHQRNGPFQRYERSVSAEGGELVERTTYRLAIPWFGWLFALPVRALIARRGFEPVHQRPHHTPWWAPPDQITPRQALVLGLLAAASMSSAFTNTLFTQTVKFAADDFGVGNTGVGVAGSIVRAGIVIAIPFAVLADRVGRQRVIRVVAWARAASVVQPSRQGPSSGG